MPIICAGFLILKALFRFETTALPGQISHSVIPVKLQDVWAKYLYVTKANHLRPE